MFIGPAIPSRGLAARGRVSQAETALTQQGFLGCRDYMESEDFRSRPGLHSQSHHFLGQSFLTSLCLSFSICKMRPILVRWKGRAGRRARTMG